MNDKCAAGTGRFLEAAAVTLGLGLEEIGPLSIQSSHRLRITNVCTVFVESEIMAPMMKGERVEDILRGVHNARSSRRSRRRPNSGPRRKRAMKELIE